MVGKTVTIFKTDNKRINTHYKFPIVGKITGFEPGFYGDTNFEVEFQGDYYPETVVVSDSQFVMENCACRMAVILWRNENAV